MLEWEGFLEDIFCTALILSLYPRSRIEIFVEVLSADGSTTLNGLLMQ